MWRSPNGIATVFPVKFESSFVLQMCHELFQEQIIKFMEWLITRRKLLIGQNNKEVNNARTSIPKSHV